MNRRIFLFLFLFLIFIVDVYSSSCAVNPTELVFTKDNQIKRFSIFNPNDHPINYDIGASKYSWYTFFPKNVTIRPNSRIFVQSKINFSKDIGWYAGKVRRRTGSAHDMYMHHTCSCTKVCIHA